VRRFDLGQRNAVIEVDAEDRALGADGDVVGDPVGTSGASRTSISGTSATSSLPARSSAASWFGSSA